MVSYFKRRQIFFLFVPAALMFTAGCLVTAHIAASGAFRQAEPALFLFLAAAFPAAAGCLLLIREIAGLRRADRAKSDFTAAVSHELKTPLTSILMGTSLLESGSLGPLSPDQSETVRTISEYSQMLTDLVNELLELARME